MEGVDTGGTPSLGSPANGEALSSGGLAASFEDIPVDVGSKTTELGTKVEP